MEWKLFSDGNVNFVDAEWYKEREAAHHLEEDGHVDRLNIADYLIGRAIDMGGASIVDLGCGDGGLLQLLKKYVTPSWGYDLMPTNIDHATRIRGVDARYTDFNNDEIEYADIAVMTEVLEHLEDPHKVVRELPSKYLIASSPYTETDEYHYEFHLWAWDPEGYAALMAQGGYKVLQHMLVAGWSQVLLCVREDN